MDLRAFAATFVPVPDEAARATIPAHPSLTSGAVFAVPPLSSTVRLVAGTDAAAVAAAALPHCEHRPLASFGLPEAVAVAAPKAIAALASNETPAVDADHCVVVDAGCGEAVLRGSDVFAPGIIASTFQYGPGDVVTVAAFAPCTAAHRAMEPQALAALKTQFVKGSYVAPAMVRAHCVVVATAAKMVAARKDVVAKCGGVAIETGGRGPVGHPSLTFAPGSPGHGALFAQNLSSMCPPALLAPAPGDRVLDMCAAPGGKSSHLVSLVRAQGPTPPGVWLTCGERSKPRAAQLLGLLRDHHGAAYVDAHAEVVARDVNKLASAGGADAVRYDRILLDPPCTGLGLRPRLRPHEHTAAAIHDSASYQRKLLSTAVSLLKPGGRLVYSTCTTTAPENEDTVRWALREFPALRLRCPTTPREQELAELARHVADVVPVGEEPQQPPAAAPIVWRFRPSPQLVAALAHGGALDAADPSVALDSVGFFVASFELLS